MLLIIDLPELFFCRVLLISDLRELFLDSVIQVIDLPERSCSSIAYYEWFIYLSYYTIVLSSASPTGLHVVWMVFSSYGRGQTLHLSRAETTVSINIKFWTNDYVDQIKRIAKFRGDWFYRSGSLCGWNIQFQILGFFLLFSSALSSCFVNSLTDHNSQRILTYDGSKDVVWRNNVLFVCPKD